MPTYTHYSRPSESQPKAIEVKKIVQTSRELITLLDKNNDIVSLVKTSDIISFDAAQLVVRGMNGMGAYTFGVENLTEITTSKGISETYTLLVNPTPQQIEDRFQEVLDYLSKNIFKGDIASVSTGGAASTPNDVLNSSDTKVFDLEEGDTVKAMSASITIAKVGTQVQMTAGAEATTIKPWPINYNPAGYTSLNPLDYAAIQPTLAALYDYTGKFNFYKMGADNYTLHADTPNPFGNTGRYTTVGGTRSDAGTSRFTSFGSDTPYLVIDWKYHKLVYINNLGQMDLSDYFTAIATQNAANLGGYNRWRGMTLKDYLNVCRPDRSSDINSGNNLLNEGIVSGFNPGGNARNLTIEHWAQNTNSVWQHFASTSNQTAQSATYSTNTTGYLILDLTDADVAALIA